jgi:hypothetical protein
LCPRCQALRSRELADHLRAWVDHRIAAGGRLFFVTLTIPKPHGYDPTPAIDEVLAHWRWRTNIREPGGEAWTMVVAGAVRSLEVTWSPKGARRKDGSLVPYDGWHAHLHLLVELRKQASEHELRALVSEWIDLVRGDERANDVQRIASGADKPVGELCKYVAKPLSQDMKPDLGRSLAKALHRRRMQVGVGSWKTWRRWAEDHVEPSEPVYYAVDNTSDRARPRTVAELVEAYGGELVPDQLPSGPRTDFDVMTRASLVLFVARRGSEVLTEVRTLEHVVEAPWSWLSQTCRDELGATGPPNEVT